MRLGRPSRALTGILVSAFALWCLAWPKLGGRKPLDGFYAEYLYGLGAAEGTFFAAAFALQALVVAWVTLEVVNRWGPRWERRLRELVDVPRTAVRGLAIVGALGSLIVALAVVHLTPLNEDEKTYLFQAKLLLLGKLSVEVPPEAKAFWQPFIVGEGRWSGQYFWAQPALLALGLRAGVPWIAPAIETGVTIAFTARAVDELAGDRRVTVLAALLAATSPQIVFTGGSLHNASLAAACGAVAIWAVIRLVKGRSIGAVVALAIATSIAIHNRPLDHVALMIGAAVTIAVARPREVPRIALRLAPAMLLTLPAVALHAFLNRAVSGSYWHSGYSMFNDGHGWQTMGFGRGPFGNYHTPAIAGTKTFTSILRVSFFSTGTAFFAIALVAWLVAGKPRRLLLAPLGPLAVYALAYFAYAGSPIHPTGPVYYTALTPVVIAWIAIMLVDVHDRIAARPGLGRLVPAFVVAQLLAAALVFWPSELAELHAQADDSDACKDLVEEVRLGRALVFVAPGFTFRMPHSWTEWPPLPSPTFDDPVLFARQGATMEEDAAVVRRFGEGRKIRLAMCAHVETAVIYEYDPIHGVGPDIRPILTPPSWEDMIPVPTRMERGANRASRERP